MEYPLVGVVPNVNAPLVPVTQVGQVKLPVVALSTNGLDALTAKVPVALGNVSVGVPAAACAVTKADPDVAPAKLKAPCKDPATPKVGVAVKAGVAPANTSPAVPGNVKAPVVKSRESGADALTAKVPEVLGNVNVGAPAALCGVIVAVPLVVPAKPIVPVDAPGMPNTGAIVDSANAVELVGLPSTVPPGIVINEGVTATKFGRPVDPVSLPQNVKLGACPVHEACACLMGNNKKDEANSTILSLRIV